VRETSAFGRRQFVAGGTHTASAFPTSLGLGAASTMRRIVSTPASVAAAAATVPRRVAQRPFAIHDDADMKLGGEKLWSREVWVRDPLCIYKVFLSKKGGGGKSGGKDTEPACGEVVCRRRPLPASSGGVPAGPAPPARRGIAEGKAAGGRFLVRRQGGVRAGCPFIALLSPRPGPALLPARRGCRLRLAVG